MKRETISVRNSLLEQLDRVDPFPSTAIRLLRAVTDDGTEIEEVARVLNQDPMLVTRVLAHANSAAQGRIATVTSLDEAVVALGMKELRDICLVALCGRYLIEGVPHPKLSKTVWAHTIASAAVARELAPRLDAPAGTAATVALFAELGRLSLLRLGVEDMVRVADAVEDGEPLDSADQRLLGVSGIQLTVVVGVRLGLPGALLELMRKLQREPESPVSICVAAAKNLTQLFGYPLLPGNSGDVLTPAVGTILDNTSGLAHRLADGADRATSVLNDADGGGMAQLAARPRDAFDALFRANRRLAAINADYQRTRDEVQANATEMKTLADTFAAVTMGLDVEALRYSTLESLLDKYRVDATFLVSGPEGGGQLAGALFKIDRDGMPEFLPLAVDLAELDRTTREALTRGLAITLGRGDEVRPIRAALGHPEFIRLAPLMIRGKCHGIIGISRRRDSAGQEPRGEFLTILAGAVALALDNATLYQRTLAEATVDPLTGMATRRVLMDALDAAGADEGKRPLGVLLVDLDHFKSVNDSLGHQAGDRYLKDVTRSVRQVLREGDVLGRFGGDEFAVVAQGLQDEELLRFAEKVREAASAVAGETRWQSVRAPLGATVGVSMLAEGVADASWLLAQADASLYAAKAAGRGRIGSIAAVTEARA